ncbi:MAG: hypothetical protein JW867_06240 [Candidatus Omnitrophica bacterium]|nr:hypothetical protein [Candidatus Omnitrophota bacterium]
MVKYLIFGLTLVQLFNIMPSAEAKSIEERLQGKKKISYSVSFNGMSSGDIEWEYLGKEKIDGKEVEVLSVNSDTTILNLFDLTSKEKVYLDPSTYLPYKVERDLKVFGKDEVVQEYYNQEKGYVKLVRNDGQEKVDILKQDKPIHNILALLYFFPDNIAFESGKWLDFNLPTQKIKIKMVKERFLNVDSQKKETYFLLGRGAKHFSLWLDKKNSLPLRLEFVFPVGKVVISPKD